MKLRIELIGLLLIVSSSLIGCNRSKPASGAAPDSVDYAVGAAAIIPELEQRVAQNPTDFVALNKLCGYYLQRQRETGDDKYIALAGQAAQASLRVIPAERNKGALAALAEVELTSHQFAAAREHAERLLKLEPGKTYPQYILFDALIELGEYKLAEEVLQLIKNANQQNVGTESRLAKFDQLHGNLASAKDHISNALALSLQQVPRPRESVAWCQWQLGELSFASGDYRGAEERYKESLTTFPDYYRALASMARVRAAMDDLTGAISYCEKAIGIVAEPALLSLLGDLYKLAGRDAEATRQYENSEKVSLQEAAQGRLHKRELALFYADHDIKVTEGLRLAYEDYKNRSDIYGSDTLAWAALKANKIGDAREAIKDALRLGTQDAKLFYHAAKIMRAAGDEAAARDYFNRAARLNAHFDPLQSRIAAKEWQQ